MTSLVTFVTPTDDQFNAQTTTHSSFTTITDTQSAPLTLSSVHGAPLMSLTPTDLETTWNPPKTETSFSASSTATETITPKTWTPAISAPKMTDLKTNTSTTTSAADISPNSIPAGTIGTIDSPPPATKVAMNTNGAIFINTIPVSTTNSTLLTAAPKASVLGGISVQCRIAAITVTIPQNFLEETNIQESTLYLGLRECGVNGGNATHVQLTVAWNECSTRLVHVSVSYTSRIYLNVSFTVYLKK